MLTFKGKTALIIGGGTGIGEAVTYRYAARGADVIVTGIREDSIIRVAKHCSEMGVNAWHQKIDLEDPSTLDALITFMKEKNLRPTLFLINSGISQRALTLETDISIDRKLMEINYFGGIYILKQLKDILLSEEEIHIAVTSSISGLFGFPLRSAYSASKRALFGFYESLMLEYPNISVTFLIPGRIRTEISRSAITASGEPFREMDPGQANGMDVNRCAETAIRAIAHKRHKKLIGGKELLMAYFYKFIPCLFYKLARKVSAH